MGILLLSLGGLGLLACWIIVLIKMFKTEKPLLGIIGIFCGLWAYIWGWMNSGKHGLQKIMLIWTACWILYIIGAIMTGTFSASAHVGTSP
ncbi:hypothetical protein [Luteolibacter sp. LG18]|uniref:hypothetical protein n=1 Tax=Luteolibacter sp. LG18 TaxID=2819286 RepID=UPI002B2C4748|nr:hypothetical protein llg_29100 [Luteolibacter sp. LG18]